MVMIQWLQHGGHKWAIQKRTKDVNLIVLCGDKISTHTIMHVCFSFIVSWPWPHIVVVSLSCKWCLGSNLPWKHVWAWWNYNLIYKRVWAIFSTEIKKKNIWLYKCFNCCIYKFIYLVILIYVVINKTVGISDKCILVY